MTANLLTECDNCEVKYETNVWGTDSESIVEENGGQYFYCTDHTSKVNKLFIVSHAQKILNVYICVRMEAWTDYNLSNLTHINPTIFMY